MTIIRTAVIQDCPVVFDRKATIEKVRILVRQASRQGARLVVMSEGFVTDAACGHLFGRFCRSVSKEKITATSDA